MDFDVLKYKDEALLLLSKLISFQSVLKEYKPNSKAPFGEENRKALNFLLDYAKNDGFETFNDQNYAGHIEFGKGKEILGILAHLDVVPVDGQNWDSNPFVLNIKDNKLFGRGAVDDKGPLIATYIAMKLLKNQGFIPNKRVRLITGCDEESGSRCLRHYFESQPLPESGFSPDADFPLIYGEKASCNFNFVGELAKEEIISNFDCGIRYNVVPAYAKMCLTKDLKAEFLNFLKENNYQGEVKGDEYIAYGIASHAMVPEKGLNASFILFSFLNEYAKTPLSEFFVKYLTFDPFGKKLHIDLHDDEMHDLTMNVGIVKIQNKKILIGLDLRVPKENHKDTIINNAKLAAAEFGLNFKLLSFGGYHYVDPNSFLVKTLMQVYKDVTKDVLAKPITIGGGTYAKFIKNAVAYGPLIPGREDVCHIANEYMYLDDFLNAILIYAKAIYELTK